jgi:hypothetical protein
LAEALGKISSDPYKFWTQQVIQVVPRDGEVYALSDLYPQVQAPKLEPQRSFLSNEAQYFGIEKEEYRRTYWGLRPDFTLRGESVLILLEAKSKGVPTKVWREPKEERYYRLLCDSRISERGFFYIVPSSEEANCFKCLSKEAFHTVSRIRVGYVLWDSLLPLLEANLLEVAVHELLRVSSGVKIVHATYS